MRICSMDQHNHVWCLYLPFFWDESFTSFYASSHVFFRTLPMFEHPSTGETSYSSKSWADRCHCAWVFQHPVGVCLFALARRVGMQELTASARPERSFVQFTSSSSTCLSLLIIIVVIIHAFNKSPWQFKSEFDVVENKVPTRRIWFTRLFRSEDVHSKSGGAQWSPRLTPLTWIVNVRRLRSWSRCSV